MAEINIDAKDAIVGRLATFAAKQALLGNTVNIVNCEAAIMSGKKSKVFERYHYSIRDLGQPSKGPFYSRMPDRFVRRIIRGMLEYKSPRGRAAYDRIMCYIGVPDKLKDAKLVSPVKNVDKLPNLKYQTVGQLCKALGGKV